MSEALAALEAAVKTALPGLDVPRLVQYRVIQAIGGRLSLQAVNPADDAPGLNNDMKPVEVWPGVPGATSTPTPGELVVVAFVGRDQYPVVLGRSPAGGPGHTPIDVKLDAVTELRLIGSLASAAAVARVGGAVPPPQPVALAPQVALALAQVVLAIASIDAYAAAVAIVSPATAPAATALATALAPILAAIAAFAAPYPAGYTSTKLEAQ